MTHIENIPHILKHGITHATSQNSNPNFTPIGDNKVISTRNNFLLNNTRFLGEYIPFYFGARTPMLYVIQNGFNTVTPISAEKIVYCVSSVQKIIDLKLDFVFSDGHAVDKFSSQFDPSYINDIESLLDFAAIKDKYWKDENDLDRKRRKEAEFLVLGDIEIESILGFLVLNETAKTKMLEYGANKAMVHIRSDYYF